MQHTDLHQHRMKYLKYFVRFVKKKKLMKKMLEEVN